MSVMMNQRTQLGSVVAVGCAYLGYLYVKTSKSPMKLPLMSTLMIPVVGTQPSISHHDSVASS